ncbi:hypothetical protein [Thalassotalea ganghwensis]
MMPDFQSITIDNQKVQLELSASLLDKILASGVINAAQLKCLNTQSKQILWHSLLNNSLLD